VLGPLAGLLVLAYAIWKLGRKRIRFLPPLASYGVIATLTILLTWPFLWENPIGRFMGVFGFMSDNPTNLSVLFGGEVYRAGELPRPYLPFMLATTLTESVWPMFLFGLLVGYLKFLRQNRNLGKSLIEDTSAESWRSLRSALDVATAKNQIVSLTLVLLWFIILVAYVLWRRPAMYDGLRHFLFILPPTFIFTGLAFEYLSQHISPSWLYAGLVLILLMPGIAAIIQLHPYEYTYYNSLIGGTRGAFRQYETDYWLTCYKEAMETLDQTVDAPSNVYVHREAYIAAYYANTQINVHDLRGALDQVKPGDYVLVNTRTNEDRRVFKDASTVLQVGRANALFCIVKQIP
jgi:hypothetical protein